MRGCAACGGSGFIHYDENHLRPCQACCLHKRSYTQGEHHPQPGAITCANCGKVLPENWMHYEEIQA